MHESQWLYWKGWRKATDFCMTFQMFFPFKSESKTRPAFKECIKSTAQSELVKCIDGLEQQVQLMPQVWFGHNYDQIKMVKKNVRDTQSKTGFLVLCKAKTAK